MVRRLGIMVIVVIAVALAACTTSTARPKGVVKGLAVACIGVNVAGGTTSDPRVTVSLYSGPTLVTSEVVPSEGDSYRFSVPPGSYVLKMRQRGPWGSRVARYQPMNVRVRAGRIVTADFPVCF